MAGKGMLVLSRFRDETLMIGDDVEVTVVDIRGDKVRLGIVAPKSLPVHRKEIWARIRRERGGNGLTLNQILQLERRRPGSLTPLAGAAATGNRGADAPGGTAPASPSGLTVGG